MLIMNIRPASLDDFMELYEIGKSTPELRVSRSEEFMEPKELKWSITNPDGVFLLAEEKQKIVGFVYANTKDIETFKHKYACLVYLVVIPKSRRRGLAQRLYQKCEKRLKEKNINYLYGWASLEGDGSILKFMQKQGFTEGHKYIWMDKKIS